LCILSAGGPHAAVPALSPATNVRYDDTARQVRQNIVSDAKILFIGPGAIGASVAAWVAENYPQTFIMGHGASQAALRQNGVTTYRFADPVATRRTVRIATVDRPGDVGDADVVVLAVKNYSLAAVAEQVKAELGDKPIIVSMANGIDNQRILPKLFSKVVYAIVPYNARRDQPVVVGYQRKGPLLIGALGNLDRELRLVKSILSRGCPTEIVDRIQDAIHTKIVINLTNALDALVERGVQPLSSPPIFQQLLTQTLWEGVRTIRAAGFREYHIPMMPSFAFLHLAAVLPGWLIRPLFRRRLRAMYISSMTQDVALRGAQDTELESITGYVVRLAAEHGVAAPYNRAIYRLGRENFHPGFKPLSCEAVLAAVEQEQARGDDAKA
jgi:2-dehydropantoate 2-reductase